MPTLTGIGLAITIDVLMRISFVLTAGLVLALHGEEERGVTACDPGRRARRGIHHAGGDADHAGAAGVPMAAWFAWPGRVRRLCRGRRGQFATAGRTATPLREPRPPGPRDRSHEKRRGSTGSWARCVPRSDEASLGPRALSWLNVPYGRLMASGLLSALLFGAIVKVTGLGLSLVRLRRIVARRVPSPAIKFCPYSG